MRVAICFSGMVRTLMQTYPSIQKCLLSPFEPDVFIHTYDKMGARKTDDLPVSEGWLRALLNPVDCRIVPQAQADPVHEQERDRLYCYPGPMIGGANHPELRWKLKNVLSQVWHVYECDKMRRAYERKNGFTYDVVIRARMDNLFRATPPLLPEAEERGRGGEVRARTILIPDHSGYGGFCDQFALGGSTAMATFCDYYLHFEKVFRSRVLVPDNWGPPENMLRRYIEKFTDLKPVIIPMPFEIQRENKIEFVSHRNHEWWRLYYLGEAKRRTA